MSVQPAPYSARSIQNIYMICRVLPVKKLSRLAGQLTVILGFLLLYLLHTSLVASAQEADVPVQEFQIFLPLVQADSATIADTGTDVGGSGERIWDPRLDDRGALLVPATVAPGQGYWRLVQVLWYDVTESAGRHHVLIDTLDEDGNRQSEVPVQIRWADGESTVYTEEKAGELYATNYAMYALAPAYSAQPADGEPADRLENMGLGNIEDPHLAHHTSYGLTWQWTIATAVVTPTLTPTVTPEITSTPTITPTVTPDATETPTPVGTPTATTTPVATAPTSTPTTSTPTTSTPTTVATTPAPTVTPEITSTPTPTPLLPSTPTATPSVSDTPFVATLTECSTSTNGKRVEGHVYVDGALADGYAITYSYPGNPSPVPNQPAISGRGYRPGFYDFVLNSGVWTTWMVDEEGNAISNVVTFQIEDDPAGCHVATVDFTSQP